MKLFIVFALLALAFADDDDVKDVADVPDVTDVPDVADVPDVKDVPDVADSVNELLDSGSDDSGEVLQEAASSHGLTYVHRGAGWPPYRQDDDDDGGYGGDDDGYGGDSYGDDDDDDNRRTYHVTVPDQAQYGPPRAYVHTPTKAYTSPTRQPFTPPVVVPISHAPHVSYTPSPSYSHEQDDDDYQRYPTHKPRYYYAYGVKDAYSGVDMAANERRDGKRTEGSYSVLQPDGRKRVVTYWVDGKSGFNADVKYYGVAKHPEPNRHAQPGYAPHSVTYQPQVPVRPTYATGHSYMNVHPQPQYQTKPSYGCGYAAMPVPVAQHRHDDDDYGGQSGYGYKLQGVADDGLRQYGRGSYGDDHDDDDDDDYYRASKRTYFPWGYSYIGPQQASCKCHYN